MSLYGQFLEDKKTKTTTQKGSLYQRFVLEKVPVTPMQIVPEKPKESFLSKAKNYVSSAISKITPASVLQTVQNPVRTAANYLADNVVSPTNTPVQTVLGLPQAATDVVRDTGKSLYEQFKNPSPQQRHLEELIGPPKNPLEKYVILPTYKTITRFLSPAFQPFADDVAEINEVSRVGGIADQVAQGKLSPSVLDEFAVLSKTAPQIVGDVAQMVLSTEAGGLFTSTARRTATAGISTALKEGAQTGMKFGAAFGAAQAASSGSKDPLEITATVGANTAFGGIFGLMMAGAVPVTSTILKKMHEARAIHELTQIAPDAIGNKIIRDEVGDVSQIIDNKGRAVYDARDPMVFEEYKAIVRDDPPEVPEAPAPAPSVSRESEAVSPDILESIRNEIELAQGTFETQRRVRKPEAIQDQVIYQKPDGKYGVVDRDYFEGTKERGMLPYEPIDGKLVAVVRQDGSVVREKPIDATAQTPAGRRLQIEKGSKDLTPEWKAIEGRAFDQVAEDVEGMIQKYLKEFDNEINVDNARELFPEYQQNRAISAAVHEPSAYIANLVYEKLLKENKQRGNGMVLFTGGGGGAGKSTGINAVEELKALKSRASIIYDATLANQKSSIKKIDQALKAGYKVPIIYTYSGVQKGVENAVGRAENMAQKLGSGRTVPVEVLVDAHLDSMASLLGIIENYKSSENVRVMLVDNTGPMGSAKLVDNLLDFIAAKVKDRDKRGEFVAAARAFLEKEYEEKRISSATVEGFLGRGGSEQVRGSPQLQREKGRGGAAEKPKARAKVDEPFKSKVWERLQAEQPEALKGDLTYDPIKLREQMERAVDLIETDKQQAFRLAMGAETSKDITSTAVNIAMSEKALADGNFELYARLTKQRSLAQTRRGQEIVSEKGSVSDNSPARFVKQLVATRLESLGKKYLAELKLKDATNVQRGTEVIDREVRQIRKRISSRDMDLAAAQKLIDSLACK